MAVGDERFFHGLREFLSRPLAQIEHGHAHGEAVGDLVEDDALRAVGDFAVDFDAAIDRAGMHDQAVRFQPFRALFGEAKEPVYSPMPGKVFLALPLVLNAQKIHDIDVGSTSSMSMRHATPSFSKIARHQRARPDQRDARAEFEQAEMFERATRLKRMSPIIATCSPAIVPLLSRIV